MVASFPRKYTLDLSKSIQEYLFAFLVSLDFHMLDLEVMGSSFILEAVLDSDDREHLDSLTDGFVANFLDRH